MMGPRPRLRDKLLRPQPEYLGFAMRGAYVVLGLLVSILLARLLGPAPLGSYYTVLAWVLLVGTTVQAGWGPFLVREVAAMHETRRFAELRGLTTTALRIVALLSFAAAGLFILFAARWADEQRLILFVIGAPAVLLLSTSSLRQAITRGMGQPLLGQVCELVTRPGVQLVGLALLGMGFLGARVTAVAAMGIFSTAIAASAAVAYFLHVRVMKETRTNEKAILPPRSEWVVPLFRTAVFGWAQTANLQVGTIILGSLSSDVDVAYFRIAQQLSVLLGFGAVVATSIHANSFSRLFVRGDLESLERLAARAALIGGGSALATAAVLALGGEWLIGSLYGAPFMAAFVPMLIMIAGQLVSAVFGPVAALAIATRNESAAMKALLFSVLANVSLCALLSSRWGAVGAAVGTALSLSSWNIILFLVLRRTLGIRAHAGAYLTRRMRLR